MEVNNYLKKFKLLIDYVFEGKVVLNDLNTEKLMKLLEDKNCDSPGKKLLETPCFSDLIFNSLENIPNAPCSVKLFIVKIITILFKNELQFTKMQMQAVQSSSIEYINSILASLGTKAINQALRLACMKLATVYISHLSGFKLLVQHKVWQVILCPNIHQATSTIKKGVYHFLSQLILNLNEYEMETEITDVLEFILKPIVSSEYLTVEIIDQEKDEALAKKIDTHLEALLSIVIETENARVNHVVRILKTYFLIEHSLYSIIEATRCSHILSLINYFFFRLFYASNRHLLFNDKLDEFSNEMVILYHNCIMQCIRKRDIPATMDFCVKCNIFLSKLEKTYKDTLTFPLQFERNGQKFELSNQFIVHLFSPILLYAFKHQADRPPNEAEEFVDKFLTKFGKTVTEHIFSTCYSYRVLLEGLDLTTMAIATIRELFRLKGNLTAAQAGTYFQCLFHVLDIFILSDGAGGLILNENPIKSPNEVRLITLVLDSIRMLLKEHNILWYENVEVMSLQEKLMNLLKQNIMNTKQIVQVLDLIDICVKKFLSPNMSLLVESRQDSTLTEIGAVMRMYMHHEEWEIRDSALNLLLSCTDISFVKYIPLQKVIRENNLIIFAAKVALTDTEYYAQSTGLKCLASAVKIESIWREVLIDNPHIYMQLVYILRNNPEGMVRKEAVNVLTRVFTNQRISPTFQTTLYEVMLGVALDDLHWEVQLAALQFWRHAINNQLTYRGMIDGKFPSVTFSKERRKIITLNEREIVRQLTSIMNHLSSIGCLTVLYECMNEVHNTEIMEQAYNMATELIEILDKYKFVSIPDSTDNPMEVSVRANGNHAEEMAIDLSKTSADERDKIIEDIVNTDQSELIMKLHDNYFQTKADEIEEYYRMQVPPKETISPNKFLETFKGTDYSCKIKDKRNWTSDVYSNLDILLDEILDV